VAVNRSFTPISAHQMVGVTECWSWRGWLLC